MSAADVKDTVVVVASAVKAVEGEPTAAPVESTKAICEPLAMLPLTLTVRM
jgi:hypothetical protein